MNTYPSAEFYFRISFGPENSASDNGFQEVSGIAVTLPPEEIQEGGLNQYKYKVPVIPTYTNVVLKRGYTAADSDLANWFSKTLGGEFFSPITTKTVYLELLNENRAPLKTWTLSNAWPVKWSVADLNVQENKLAIESLELAYSHIDV